MSNSSVTDLISMLSEAEQMMQSSGQSRSSIGRQPDLDEDFKEIVKQAIYEVREEQRGESRSGQSGSGSGSGGQQQSGSSGSSTLRQLMMALGFAAAGYMAYKRRQSQTPTHLEHSGQTRHTSPSDLPEAETKPNEPEPTSGESSGS